MKESRRMIGRMVLIRVPLLCIAGSLVFFGVYRVDWVHAQAAWLYFKAKFFGRFMDENEPYTYKLGDEIRQYDTDTILSHSHFYDAWDYMLSAVLSAVGVGLVVAIGSSVVILCVVALAWFYRHWRRSREERHELSLAAAALLTHAARLDDGQMNGIETDTLRHVLQDGFNLSEAETTKLMSYAEIREAEATDLYRWTKVINDRYDLGQKINLIEKLWLVVLSDGRLDDYYETSLLHGLSGLLYIPAGEINAARQRAAASLNLNRNG